MPIFRDTAKSVQVTVEYYAPHWIVLVRNAGQSDWAALRDQKVLISVQDEFGTTIKTRPAIKSFPHMQDAEDYIKEHLSGADRIGQRAQIHIRKFANALASPVNALSPEMQTS